MPLRRGNKGNTTNNKGNMTTGPKKRQAGKKGGKTTGPKKRQADKKGGERSGLRRSANMLLRLFRIIASRI